MRFPRRGVVLADPGFLIAEFIEPAQRLQIPVVTLFQPALRRMGRHREISDLHGVSSRCSSFQSASVARKREHSTPGVRPRYDETAGQRFGFEIVIASAYFPSPLVGEGAFATAKADEGFSRRRRTPHPSRCRCASAIHLLPQGEKEESVRLRT